MFLQDTFFVHIQVFWAMKVKTDSCSLWPVSKVDDFFGSVECIWNDISNLLVEKQLLNTLFDEILILHLCQIWKTNGLCRTLNWSSKLLEKFKDFLWENWIYRFSQQRDLILVIDKFHVIFWFQSPDFKSF